jgi:ABC-type Mn2+/Zn2+ transport system permease subunit
MNVLDALAHPFFANAMLAGTAIAAACGLVGYFLVLRAQIFTGDALSHVAFTGALAALAFGLDPVAAARGLPVRLLGLGFLALVGACAAEATRAVGALLLLGLLAAPAGAASRPTTRPYLALGLSVLLAVPVLPPSFAIVAVAAGVYAMVLAGSALRDKTRTAVA